MSKFKVGDKVRIKDEVLTQNLVYESWGQDARGKNGEIKIYLGEEVYEVSYPDSERRETVIHEKHLLPAEEFKVGDWVYVKDEPLTCCDGIELGDQGLRGSWREVIGIHDPDNIELEGRDHVAIHHATLSPFKREDHVEIGPNPTYASGAVVPPDLIETMQRYAHISDLGGGDFEGDVMVNGVYVHKRFLTPVGLPPVRTVPLSAGLLNNLADLLSKPEPEAVDHPEHYNRGAFETIDVIADWKLNYNVGNVLKYISRYNHKGNPVEDLRKAIWYLEREIIEIDS